MSAAPSVMPTNASAPANTMSHLACSGWCSTTFCGASTETFRNGPTATPSCAVCAAMDETYVRDYVCPRGQLCEGVERTLAFLAARSAPIAQPGGQFPPAPDDSSAAESSATTTPERATAPSSASVTDAPTARPLPVGAPIDTTPTEADQ